MFTKKWRNATAYEKIPKSNDYKIQKQKFLEELQDVLFEESSDACKEYCNNIVKNIIDYHGSKMDENSRKRLTILKHDLINFQNELLGILLDD